MLGIVHFTTKMQLVPLMSSVFQHRDEWSWQTVVMGVGFLVLLLTTRKIVGVSVFKILLHVTRPNTVVMGNIHGTSIYRNIARHNEAVRIPSFLIIDVEAPIYFANSTYLQKSHHLRDV